MKYRAQQNSLERLFGADYQEARRLVKEGSDAEPYLSNRLLRIVSLLKPSSPAGKKPTNE